jgi:hypothetical protein
MPADLDLAALDELVAAATPGPLRVDACDRWGAGAYYTAYDIESDADPPAWIGTCDFEAESRAIVALRNAYPALRQLIDQQAAELERLRRVARAAEALLAADVETEEHLPGLGLVCVSPSCDEVERRREALQAALAEEPR